MQRQNLAWQSADGLVELVLSVLEQEPHQRLATKPRQV